MRFDGMLDATLSGIGPSLDQARTDGRDGAWVIETAHDPFLLLATVAERAAGLRLGTAVAVAFARTPMLLALVGNDLQIATKGNFVLGLGTQVRAHVERRYSMPYGKPVARMREMIAAIHAIWDSWESGEKLAFAGEYYTHTLMTPMFTPPPHEYGRPPIHLGALGPLMTQLAGEMADGIVLHRMMSERYIREVTLPNIEAGLARRVRPLARPFEVVYPPFIAASDDDDELRRQIDALRKHVSFYASTPTYQPILAMHGMTAIGERLHALSRAGEWDAMTDLIDDDMLEPFALICRPDEVRDALLKRFDHAVDRVVLYPPGH